MADTKRATAGADQSITRHPLFPGIVALWCGALFGLASVLVGASTVEGVVQMLGIDKVIPMAAPPLGTTMRILLALAMTGVGAAIGAVIARRIARPAPALGRRRSFGKDEEPAAAEADDSPRRRRALAIQPDEAAADVAEPAPIPGGEPQILDVTEFDLDGFEDADASFRRRPAARDAEQDEHEDNLPAWLDAESAWHDPASPSRDNAPVQVFQAELEAAEQAQSESEKPGGSSLFEAYSREFMPQAEPEAVAVFEDDEAIDEPPLATADSVERTEPGFRLLPRLPQGDWSAETPIAMAPVEDAVIADTLVSATIEAVPPVTSQAGTDRSAARRIAEADLDTLSPVELVERLALAMANRREAAQRAAEADAAAQVFAPPPPLVMPFAAPVLDEAPEGEPVDASVTPQATIAEAAWPVPLRPVALDDAAVEPLPGYVPPRHIGLAPRQVAFGHDGDESPDFDPHAAIDAIPFPRSPFPAEADADEEEEAGVLEQGYSSLLNLSRRAGERRPFLQFDHADESEDTAAEASFGDESHEPAPFIRPVPTSTAAWPEAETRPETEIVIPVTDGEQRPFDAPSSTGGRPDPTDTERALRAALATLQRMSGAA